MKKDKKKLWKTVKNSEKGWKTAEKRRKNSESGEKRQKTLVKRRNGKKLWKRRKLFWGPPLTAKIILGAASKFFLALAVAAKKRYCKTSCS